MTHGEKLFSAILLENNPIPLFRVQEEWLDSASERAIFKFLKEYVRDHQKLPGMRSAVLKFPQLDDSLTASSKFYLDELWDRHVYSSLLRNVPNVLKNLKADPRKGLDDFKALIADLHTPSSSKDEGYDDKIQERVERYIELQGSGGITYMSTGDAVLDQTMYGYHKNDLITIGGRAGTKKTWLMCLLSILVEKVIPAHLGPALFVSNEISATEINERNDCINFRLNVARFNSKTLQEDELGRYLKGAKIRSAKKSTKLKTIFNCNTLEELHEKILIYQPSIVFVDGSYLLEPKMEEGYNKTVFITRNLKALAMDAAIPILNTTQLRKKTGRGQYKNSLDGQDEFYHGSYSQDSDFAIRMFIEPEMVLYNKTGMDFVKGRRIPPNTMLEWEADLDNISFKFHNELSHSTKAAKESDEEISF